MYRQPEKITAAPGADDWEQLKVKFRARFGSKIHRETMCSARLEESPSVSRLCISVIGIATATELDNKYLPSLRQIWSNVTGCDAEIIIVARTQEAASLIVDQPLPLPAGVLSDAVSPATEAFVDRELLTFGRFTSAMCLGYVSQRYHVDTAKIVKQKRAGAASTVRWVAIYLIHSLTALSYSQLGKHLGGLTKKCVHESIHRVDELRVRDEAFDQEIQSHIEYLRGREKAVLKAAKPH